MRTLVVFYDGWCPLCQASASNIRRLDWFHRIAWQSFRDTTNLERFSLQPSDQPFEQRIVSVRVRDGKVFEGIHTFIQIACRIPLLWLFVPLLLVTIWLGIGERMYDWVANKRTIIPTGNCTDEKCFIHARDSNNTSKTTGNDT